MGSGDLKIGHMNFHIHMPHVHFLHHHHHHGGKRDPTAVPKGCMAVTVGVGAEQQKFVIPVMYVNHPLFMELLKEAEEEYGFDQKGPINIPCHVEEFCQIRGLIDKETTSYHHHHTANSNNHHHNHHHNFLCFKA